MSQIFRLFEKFAIKEIILFYQNTIYIFKYSINNVKITVDISKNYCNVSNFYIVRVLIL